MIDRWVYRGIHLAIAAAGIAAIVGSGGGGFISWDPCSASYCSDTVRVTVEPSRQTVQVGHTATFRGVKSFESGPVLSYQWCRYAPGGSTCVAIPGATGPNLSIQNAALADDEARYEVTARGTAMSSTSSGELLVSTAPALVFEDSEFVEDGWVWSGFVGDGQGTPSSAVQVSRPTAGGHPGAYRVIEYGPLSNGERMFATHVAQAANYDSAQFGAIYSIDFRAECKALVGDGVRMSIMPLLRQGVRTYAGSPLYAQSCEGPGWNLDSGNSSMLASSFAQILAGPACGAGEACPDFSASGAPITFGMYTLNSQVDPGASGVASHGVDNWRVSVWRR